MKYLQSISLAPLLILCCLFWVNVSHAQTITIISDGTWQGETPPQPGWTTQAYNATAWPLVSSPNLGNTIPVVPGSQSMWKANNVLATDDTALMRKSFVIPVADSYTGNITINADNEYKLFFNGVLMGSNNNWSLGPYSYPISPLLVGCVDNVIAVEGVNWSGPQGVSLVATIDPVNPLYTPVANPGINNGCTIFTASWSAVPTAVNYLLDISTDPNFTTFVPGYQNLSTGPVTSYNPGGLSSGMTYYYRVRAERPPLVSCYSNVVAVNTLPSIVLNLYVGLCQGQTYTTGGGTTVSSSAVITDTLVSMTGCDSVVTYNIVAANASVTVTSNTAICSGQQIQLNASGGNGTFSWTPAAGLSATNIANPIANPAATTTYTVSSQVQMGNMIPNGDFEQGNVGFTSQYFYNPNLQPQGFYYITTSPALTHPNFQGCSDHTPTGVGNMMVVNGATNPGAVVWEQTLGVSPNTDYNFSAWATNVVAGATGTNIADLQFSVNGFTIGPVFSPNLIPCIWTQFTSTWNSGANTTATISILNQNTTAGGNDFALDDIEFYPICSAAQDVTITVNPTYSSTVNASICQGQTYNLPNGTAVSTAGVYPVTLQTVNNCDSTITTNLTIQGAYNQTVNAGICQGQSYVLPNGNNVSVTGSYVVNFVTSGGCDSIVTTNLTVYPNFQSSVNAQICQGQSYNLPDGTSVNTTGAYPVTLQTVNNCDSIVTTNLTVYPTYSFSQNFTICQGENHLLPNGQSVNVAGIYPVTLLTIRGCDSLITTTLNVNPAYNQQVNVAICPGQSHTLPNGTTVQAAGQYSVTLNTANGCDSTIVTNLSIYPSPTAAFDAPVVCEGFATVFQNYSTYDPSSPILSYAWNLGDGSPVNYSLAPAYTYAQAGTYQVSLLVVDDKGCRDSLQKAISVQITPQAPVVFDDTVCLGKSKGMIAATPLGTKAYWYYLPTDTVPFFVGNVYNTVNNFSDKTYYVQAISDYACVSPKVPIRLSVKGEILAEIDPVYTVVELPNSTVSFSLNTSEIINSYLWWFTRKDSAVIAQPTYQYQYPGIYPVSLDIVDKDGCMWKREAVVEVKEVFGLTIPTAFSPNGDGYNDDFLIGAWQVSYLFFEVYDRWGRLVYSTEQPDFRWAGKDMKGVDLPEGVYVYRARATFYNGRKTDESGTITLAR